MIALLYVVRLVGAGDATQRLFFDHVTKLQPLATASLVGLLVTTWLTCLAILPFTPSI